MRLIIFISAAALVVSVSLSHGQGVPPGTYSIAQNVSEGIQNMRSGPGQGHQIIVAIPAGATGVELEYCRRPDDGRSGFDWCKVKWRQYSGWVSSCCLVHAGSASTTSPRQSDASPTPPGETATSAQSAPRSETASKPPLGAQVIALSCTGHGHTEPHDTWLVDLTNLKIYELGVYEIKVTASAITWETTAEFDSRRHLYKNSIARFTLIWSGSHLESRGSGWVQVNTFGGKCRKVEQSF